MKINKEDIQTIKDLLEGVKELNDVYQDGWGEVIDAGEELISRVGLSKNGKIGTFTDELEAAKAYQLALDELNGVPFAVSEYTYELKEWLKTRPNFDPQGDIDNYPNEVASSINQLIRAVNRCNRPKNKSNIDDNLPT